MAKGKKRDIVSHLLRRWFLLLAAVLTLVVWVSLGLAMLPIPEADGRLGKNPFGIVTALENRALDILFQLRDALHPETRRRGPSEPITLITASGTWRSSAGTFGSRSTSRITS